MMVKTNMRSAANANILQYRKLSLISLIRKITKGDRLALNEFHNHRTIFRYPHMKPLLFAEYVDELRKGLAKREWPYTNSFDVANNVYSLTVDKFSNLPSIVKKNDQKMKHTGPDCRFYFRAVMRKIEQRFQKEKPSGHIKEETMGAKILQGMVRRHFILSRFEVERTANPFWSRYFWNVKGSTIPVWLPVYIKGRERGKWLEKNIDDPDPSRELEHKRIQGIIKKKLVSETIVPLKEERISGGTRFSNRAL